VSRQKYTTHRDWRSNAPHLIARAVGVIFLSAVFMKMMDMDLLIRQMRGEFRDTT
jgi:hypothetical protein